MEETSPQHVEIARFSDLDRVHEYGLVVLSQRAPYWVVEEAGSFGLLVEASRAEYLRGQLALYDRESVNWPPLNPELQEEDPAPLAALSWLVVLFLTYGISLQWPGLYAWGKLSAEAVMTGEVYRAFTALFLHGDFGHLMGNLVFGAVFLHLVALFIGTGRAWLGVLAAGFCGNLLNAWIYYPAAHYSIGASTAVFGAIGMLVALPAGFAVRHAGVRLFQMWTMPLVIGLIFLAWFGTGSENTDTSAHLTGFACGLPFGAFWGFHHAPRSGQPAPASGGG